MASVRCGTAVLGIRIRIHRNHMFLGLPPSGAGSEAGSGSISQSSGSGDPDPQQNVTDPQHCAVERLQQDTKNATQIKDFAPYHTRLYTFSHLFQCWSFCKA